MTPRLNDPSGGDGSPRGYRLQSGHSTSGANFVQDASASRTPRRIGETANAKPGERVFLTWCYEEKRRVVHLISDAASLDAIQAEAKKRIAERVKKEGMTGFVEEATKENTRVLVFATWWQQAGELKQGDKLRLQADGSEPIAAKLVSRKNLGTYGSGCSELIVEGLDAKQVEVALRRLLLDGRIVEGGFRPGGVHREWCDAEVLRLIRRKSLARLRKEVEPVEQQMLARLNTHWQGVLQRRRGLDSLLDTVESLQGAPLPASLAIATAAPVGSKRTCRTSRWAPKARAIASAAARMSGAQHRSPRLYVHVVCLYYSRWIAASPGNRPIRPLTHRR